MREEAAMTGMLVMMAAVMAAAGAEEKSGLDYGSQVAPILRKYCAGCHNEDFPEGELSLETYQALQKGAKHGPAVLPGDVAGSLMIRVLTGQAKPAMPPKGEPRPGDREIRVLEAWIEAGAKGPEGKEPDRLALVVPEIESSTTVRPVGALESSRDGRWTAVARDKEVMVYEGWGERVTAKGARGRRVGEFPGPVTAVHFSRDGTRLVVASGVPGLGGVASIWEVESGQKVRVFEGHRDLLYDAELSPDGKTLATCGYDRMIEIWDVESGRKLRTLEGHTGAVYDVGFSPDGRFLVSASADDTCKVWRVSDGMRMDTLPQPLEAEYCCRFSPDGERIVAGGADNNIRVWRFVSREKPEINPMEKARFAHEGAIVRLEFSEDGKRIVTVAEDRTVKAWRASDLSELKLWGEQPDVGSALGFGPDGRTFVVGRMDGSLETYRVPEGRAGDLERETEPEPETVAVRDAKEGPVFEGVEKEPNDQPGAANEIRLPAKIKGVIEGGKGGMVDEDWYRFSARAGETWVFEVEAARAGSKLDSFVEVRDEKGERVPRVLLQAVRDSYFTFRGKNGTESGDFRLFNWQEMSLNDYLYANGEVARLWLYPRGPDSGFLVYPGQGARWGYFDTTPLAHALNEPCYVVRAYEPGAEVLENGLPRFTIYYENDDEAHRELGKDSRLHFSAPRDGQYVLKVRDVRGLQGQNFTYTLTARSRRPDFSVKLEGANPKVAAGSAREFKVKATRRDGFEGAIRVEVEGVPEGFRVTTPLEIEAGQMEALGVVEAQEGATWPEQAGAMRVRAVAEVEGKSVVHEVNSLGKISVEGTPKLRVAIEPVEGGARPVSIDEDGVREFEIEPGETIELKVTVERLGFEGRVPFGNEGSGRNLPFGTIIDNLGLNGLMVMEGQTERRFFVTADRISEEQTRLFHLNTAAAGGVASRPVRLRVVRRGRGE